MNSNKFSEKIESADESNPIYEQILDSTFQILERDEDFTPEVLSCLRELRKTDGFQKAQLLVDCLLPGD